MIKKVDAFFEKYGVSLENKKVCVCFSGGSDSVCLLLCILELKEKLKGKTDFSLCAVHVNHQIRGDEADRDEKFCIDFCKEKNVELFVSHVDVPKESQKTGEGLEETARKLRYGVFESLKAQEKIDYFLTAHHANDSGETIIFNLLRGCSVSGITGIPPVRDFYLRPLISCEKSEILSYLSQKNAVYVEDGTNLDEDYTRNYIRNNLFPKFERVNKNFLSAIVRLSESAALDEDYFKSQVEKIDGNTNLCELHPSLVSRYVCQKYESLSGGEAMSGVHVKKILSLLSSEEEKYVDVPFGITAIISKGKVIFQKKVVKDSGETINLLVGENFFGDTKIILEKRYLPLGEFRTHPFEVIIDLDKIKGKIYARKRKEGDKILCRNMSRNINKEFVNQKISKRLRDEIPVICDDEGVIFVPYLGADDRVYTKGIPENPLKITVSFADNFSDI